MNEKARFPGSIITYDDLPRVRGKHKDKVVIFCSGAFDLLHYGHIFFFNQCRKLGDILVVGVGCDRDVLRYKSSQRPIFDEKIRLETVVSLNPVDYCFLTFAPSSGHFLDGFKEIFQKLQPDLYVVNKGTFDLSYREELAGEYNVKVIVLDKLYQWEDEVMSTTRIIERIIEYGKDDQ